MIIKPMIRNNICMNAHPLGCVKEVDDQIAFVQSKGTFKGPAHALIIGSSTGYGLASRIALAFGTGTATIGVAFEREPSDNRTGTMGWYNDQAFANAAKKAGLKAESINADAFSDETKQNTIDLIKKNFGKVDLVVYSLASPVRTDPKTGEQYRSVLKPVSKTFTAKSINPQTGEFKDFSIEPANDEEIRQTIKVMGGEDWALWLDALKKAGVLSQNAKTIAYSYIGPDVTRDIYRDGTIGKAKEDLEKSAAAIRASLSSVSGEAYVSINKALVTRASAAIPTIPLYLSLLFRVMKNKKIHEDCIAQMDRLFRVKVYGGKALELDGEGRIRMDDWEMRDDVQNEIKALWVKVSQDNLSTLGDLAGYNEDFLRIHGFGRSDVDYDAEIAATYPLS